MDKDLDQGDRPLRSSSPLPASEHSDRATEMTDKRDGLPSYDESLSSIGNISKDSRTSYWDSDVDMPLTLKDCDPDFWEKGSDYEFSPSEWDGSEGGNATWRVNELDLVAYGVPKVFLRKIPKEAKGWKRAKVLVEPNSPNSFYFFMCSMSASGSDTVLL